MRDGICILLVEQDNGEIGVQLFANEDAVREPFENLKGKPGDKKSRATLVRVTYVQEDSPDVCSRCKVLPIVESAEGMPDGYILGQGPVTFEKEDKKD